MAKPIPWPFDPEWWQWNEDETVLVVTPKGAAIHDYINSQPRRERKLGGDWVAVDVIPN